MPNAVNPDWSPARAKEARLAIERARRKGGGIRLQEVHLYPEVVKLTQKGWNDKDIARYFKEAGGPGTDRRIRQIRKGQMAQVAPVPNQELPADVQSMLQWDINSFEKFFLTFSPHDYFPKHAKKWVEAFLRERRLLLNVPPGHAKSEFFMIWIPTWLICMNRNVQILMVSKSGEDAATWAMEVSGQLESNPDLVATFGRFAPETTGDQRWKPGSGVFSVMGRTRKLKGAQYTMESRGMTGRVLGRRADFVLVDDPTNQEDAELETSRIKSLKHLRQQVFSRAEPSGDWHGGRIVVIGQRVHLLDMYGDLERQEWQTGPLKGTKAWHTEKYPAVLDWGPPVKTLWPERWPWSELEQAYADVGGEGPFWTMYQQQPRPEGEAIFKPEHLEACKDHKRGAFKGFQTDDPFLPVVRVLSVDPSPTKWNGIIVGDLYSNREKFVFAITEVYRLKAGYPALKERVDEIIDRAHPDYFIFEESGFLKWFNEDPWWVELQDRISVTLHHTGMNKNSQEYGVQSLAGDFEFQNISLPYGDAEGKKMTDLLLDEALVYPSGATDDILMALWFAKFNYKKMSPVRYLPTSTRGAGGGAWSWLKKRSDKSAQDQHYERWRQKVG